MSDNVDRHYGIAAVLRSLSHFIMGRTFAALSTFAVLVIVVRELSIAEFAVYASLHALVRIIGLVTSFGVNPLLLRILPELRAGANNRATYRMLVIGVVLRSLFYALGAGVCFGLSSYVSEWLKLGDWSFVLTVYLMVGYFRITSLFLSATLESLLWQLEAQYSLAISATLRLAAVGAVLAFGALDLTTFVSIELASEGLALALLAIGALRRWLLDDERHVGDVSALRSQATRYVRFAGWAYVQNLTSLGYGSAPNRLFVTWFFGPTAISLFGVIDRLTDYVRRYEPSQLFVGLIRPVFNSHYAEDRSFQRLGRFSDLLIRINLTVLLLPIVAVLPIGHELFGAVMGESYADGWNLFALFYFIATLGSINTVVDVLVKLVERTQIYLVSNAILSSSLLLAIPMIPYVGLWSLAIANFIGLATSLLILFAYMKSQGHRVPLDLTLVGRLLGAALCAAAAGLVAANASGSPSVGAVVSVLVVAAMIWLRPPFNPEEIAIARQFAARRFSFGYGA